jgi:uncharacterized protein (TIGR00297 family)
MKYEEMKLGDKVTPSLLPIVLMAIIFPTSVIFWVLNFFFGIITTTAISYADDEYTVEGADTMTPTRFLLASTVSVLFTTYGLKKRSLDKSGALTALLVGFFLTLGSYCFTAALLAFFLSASRATKFRGYLKKKFEEDYKEGGQRNALQVICNGGMATELTLLYLIDVGYGERPIAFSTDYRASWLATAILGALACANGDTWASELGTVTTIISSQPRLITSWKKVPKGTNGGVTIGGLLFSLFGGLFVGLAYYVTLIFTLDSAILAKAVPQWPVIIVGGLGGLMGSIIDSYLGAIFQYSGIDDEGKIHEAPGPDIKHISGSCLLDNHSVNLVSTILTGLLLPSIGCILMWPQV